MSKMAPQKDDIRTYQLLATNAKLGRGHGHRSNGMREDECPFQFHKIDGII